MLTWKKPCWMPWCSSWKTLKEALVVWSQHLRGSQHRCIVQWGLCDPPGDPGRLGGAKGWEWLLPSPAESCGTATTMPPGSLPFWQSLAVTAYNRRTSSRCSRYCRSIHRDSGHRATFTWHLLCFHRIKCLPRTRRPSVWTAPGWGSFWSEIEAF